MPDPARTRRLTRALGTRQRLLDARTHQVRASLHDAETALTGARTRITEHATHPPAGDVAALRTWQQLGAAKGQAVTDHEHLVTLAHTDLTHAQQEALTAATRVAALERVSTRQEQHARQQAQRALDLLIDDHINATHVTGRVRPPVPGGT